MSENKHGYITDGHLLAAAKTEMAGGYDSAFDSPAFEKLLLKYERLIFYIAKRYFQSHEDALDASQDAAIKIYKALPRAVLPESGSLKSWVCTITARTCLDSLRKQRGATVELTEEAVASIREPSAEESAEANERVQEVLQAINKLPDDHRMVLILRDMQGLNYEDLANALKISIGTVKSRLSRARLGLKKLLEEKENKILK